MRWPDPPASTLTAARLSMLRNAIMHGDEVSDDLWKHQGHHQLNLVHDKLVAALRAFAAEAAGDDLLALSPSDRDVARRQAAAVKAIEAMRAPQKSSGGSPTTP
jgi:hypothetical protein